MIARSDSLPGLPSLTRGTTRLPRLPGIVAPEYPGARRPDKELPRPEPAKPPWQTKPFDWPGSLAEWAMYWASLEVMGDGMREFPYWGGKDWGYRTPIYGNIGIIGFLPDFLYHSRYTSVNVNDGRITLRLEQLRARILVGLNPPITHVIVDAEDALANPTTQLNDALVGVSHSAFGNLI